MINEIYINKIKDVKLNKTEILKDFDIFKISVKIDYSTQEKFSISHMLKKITNDIYAVKYTNNSDEAYALIKKIQFLLLILKMK